MIVIPYQTKILTEPFPLELLLHDILGNDIGHGDIIVIASKVVSISEGRVISLSDLIVTEEAWALAIEYHMNPLFCQAILQEADEILGGVPGVITTMKNGIVTPFAGVDQSNVPKNHAVLWPKNPTSTAQRLHEYIKKTLNISVGVIISDSQIAPLRVGTYGVAIAVAGFDGIIDRRGEKDLFGKIMHITRLNLADNLASAANLVMGETTERSPFVLIKGLPIQFSEMSSFELTRQLLMDPDECLIFGSLSSWGPDNDNSNLPRFS
ncbi:MAG: coenzyme F420-0:L-glutamate ligase [Caldisericia bacterium]|nr:coenzyme F420-0:L-glutamate ligase [Caldisericia bacterium]